ncbi:MAG: outer membrane protein assembly factor BamE [Gammaproteobacteria bacterium]|nr:outer membrane protein assembly factor BamE [Gammaproteobacteria bacterium]
MMRSPVMMKPMTRTVAALLTAVVLAACVYRIDVQQGNLLDEEDIAAVKPGMTRNQVRFLLGTPVIADSFRPDRWDYVYYLRKGRDPDVEKRWVLVNFDGDKVRDVQRDVPFDQPS